MLVSISIKKKIQLKFFVPLKVSGVLGVVVRSLLGKDGHNFETEFVFKNKIILSRSQICSIVPATIWFYNLGSTDFSPSLVFKEPSFQQGDEGNLNCHKQ